MTSSANAPTADTVILEFDVIPLRDPPSYHRLFADGRVEERSTVGVALGNDGRVKQIPREDVWRPVYTLGIAEVEQLRGAFRDLQVSTLADSYPAPEAIKDGSRMEWTLWDDGAVKHIVVDGYPANHVEALDQVLTTFNGLRKPAPPSSIWRVDLGTPVERLVGCDVSSLPAFRPVIQALFDPSPSSSEKT